MLAPTVSPCALLGVNRSSLPVVPYAPVSGALLGTAFASSVLPRPAVVPLFGMPPGSPALSVAGGIPVEPVVPVGA